MPHTLKRQSWLVLVWIVFSTSAILAQRTDAERRAQLSEAADTVARHGYTFQVADNPAMAFPLAQICGMRVPDSAKWASSLTSLQAPVVRAPLSLPSRFDWREQVTLPPIRNQGNCGSCWAFSTLGTMECAVAITEGIQVNLSEQYLVDCDTSSNGCSGGWYAFDMAQTSGIPLDTHIPYLAVKGTCNQDAPRPYYVESSSYVAGFTVPSTEAIKQAIYDNGPISATVYVGSLFQAYRSGIFNANEAPDATSVNHGIVLVGWDDNNGSGYWILRNSWDTWWGEQGYMRIAYGTSNVGFGAAYVNYWPHGSLNAAGTIGNPDLTIFGDYLAGNRATIPDPPGSRAAELSGDSTLNARDIVLQACKVTSLLK